MSTSWETVGSKGRTSESLRKRAKKRTVEQVGERTWRVHGSKKLGDAYPEYIVTMTGGDPKFECTCYRHGMGEVRRRRMCSHVLAVVLWRKQPHKEWVVESTPVLEPATEPEPEVQSMGEGSVAGGGADPVREVDTTRDETTRQGGGEADGRFLSVTAGTLDQIALDPHHRALGKPPLPDKFTEYRPNQWQAILDILEHLETGKKVVMLSAPTGSGKTLIGETVRRLMPGRKVYACTTKSLQDQILRDFPYAKVIKGRANYPTLLRRDLTADDCTATQRNGYTCEFCNDVTACPYRVAKNRAAMAQLPVLNIAYYLGETSARNSDFAGRDLVIIDEADTLEEQLMGNIEVVISPYVRRSIGVNTLPKKTVAGDWVRWLEDEVVPGIVRKVELLKIDARSMFGTDTKKMRQVKKLGRLLDRIKPLLAEDEDGNRNIEDGWVMTGYEGSRDSDATVRFKPVKVDRYAHDVLWGRGQQFLLMSATLISPAQMADDLGLDDDEWAVVNLESTFPVENRPVFINDVGPVTHKTKQQAWPKLAKKVDELADENPGVRILVHTVSYMLTKHLMENVKTTRVMTYRDAKDRERVLAEFLEVDDAILLAPSFERGIDLPEEDCQVIAIAKVPYPYLGDKQISARLYSRGGQSWYAVQTIRAIVQMTGRGMRSKDDWCDSYVLDSSFKRLYRENRTLFPKWWRDALVPSVTDPKYRPLIQAARERKEGR